jgi:outer membrane murein-binding lipoprotein Lpp
MFDLILSLLENAGMNSSAARAILLISFLLIIAYIAWKAKGFKDNNEQEHKTLNVRLDGLDGRMDKVDARIDRVEVKIDKVEHKMDEVESRLNDRMDRVESKLNDRMDKMENRFDEKTDMLDAKMNSLAVIVSNLAGKVDILADNMKTVLFYIAGKKDPTLEQTKSPVGLSPRGEEMRIKLEADKIIENHKQTLRSLFEDEINNADNPYDIQTIAFNAVNSKLYGLLNEQELLLLKNEAFRQNVEIEYFRTIFRILFRDEILKDKGISVDDFSNNPQETDPHIS